MRLDVVPDNFAEWIVGRLNLAPTPLAHTMLAMLLARAVLEGSRAGIFDAVANGPLRAPEVASRCQLDAGAAAKLLAALATSGYLTYDASDGGRFGLTPMARKWMLAASPSSLHDKMLFTFYEAAWIDRMGDYLRSGAEVSGGGHLGRSPDPDFWRLYQRAMRSLAAMSAAEVARRTYVPKNARHMLDIGGSHGLYSVAICRRHDGLSSVILDLPEAVEQAAPLVAAEGMGERVTHRAGDVLATDLGEDVYDLVFISSLVHHFDDPTNRDLMKRIARALRADGAVVVQETIRRDSPTQGGQMGALLDLYFALTSQAGTWSVRDIAAWQRDAGLQPRRPLFLRSMPGSAQQAAVKRVGIR